MSNIQIPQEHMDTETQIPLAFISPSLTFIIISSSTRFLTATLT